MWNHSAPVFHILSVCSFLHSALYSWPLVQNVDINCSTVSINVGVSLVLVGMWYNSS